MDEKEKETVGRWRVQKYWACSKIREIDSVYVGRGIKTPESVR